MSTTTAPRPEDPQPTTAQAKQRKRQSRAKRIDATPLSPRERMGRIGAGLAGLLTVILWAHFLPPGSLGERIPLSLLCAISAMTAVSPFTTEATFVRERLTRGERTVTKVVGVAVVMAIILYWINDLGGGDNQSFLWLTSTTVG